MADKIYIRDLALRCIIGVYPEERREKQDVIINIVLECDHSAAAKSDRIEEACVFVRFISLRWSRAGSAYARIRSCWIACARMPVWVCISDSPSSAGSTSVSV